MFPISNKFTSKKYFHLVEKIATNSHLKNVSTAGERISNKFTSKKVSALKKFRQIHIKIFQEFSSMTAMTNFAPSNSTTTPPSNLLSRQSFANPI